MQSMVIGLVCPAEPIPEMSTPSSRMNTGCWNSNNNAMYVLNFTLTSSRSPIRATEDLVRSSSTSEVMKNNNAKAPAKQRCVITHSPLPKEGR